jgi:hypothetical protein
MADINIEVTPEDDPIEDAVESVEDEVDELVTLVNEVKATGENNTEILGRIETCLNRLEALSTLSSESPMLLQIQKQVTEMQAELQSLKSSMDTRPQTPPPNELEPEAIVVEPAEPEPEPESLMVEVPAGNVENPPIPPKPIRRWI